MVDREHCALAFHAAPPPGQWINDPNALIHADGAYRLFVQHRGDPPAFQTTGWGRFSSHDLMRWQFDGTVIPAVGTDWAYSGSVALRGKSLWAIHTSHDDGLEGQVSRFSTDAGKSWSEAERVKTLGPPSRNRRDPFLLRDGEGWGLLLAEPCDWTGWRTEAASKLRLYRSDDGQVWREAGVIGPWRPLGVMWEVPVLARIGRYAVLFISEVDRRGGGATCSVRAWIGRLNEDGFVLAKGVPAEGQLVDHGPDFYALMTSLGAGWPLAERLFVGWLSSWQTAREMPWPGFHGGPISLPRSFFIEESGEVPWLRVRPMAGADTHFVTPVSTTPLAGMGRVEFVGDHLTISLAGKGVTTRADVDFGSGSIHVVRQGTPPMDCSRLGRFKARPSQLRTASLFIDGPIVELFIDETLSMSMAVNCGEAPLQVAAIVSDRPLTWEWKTLA